MGTIGTKVLPSGRVANGPMDNMTMEANMMTAVAVVAGILMEFLMTALSAILCIYLCV